MVKETHTRCGANMPFKQQGIVRLVRLAEGPIKRCGKKRSLKRSKEKDTVKKQKLLGTKGIATSSKDATRNKGR